MDGAREIYYENYSMEGEIINFVKVWFSVIVSLTYCSFTAKLLPKGLPRLLAFLPVICLFLALPFNLHSMHLGGMTVFFLVWLANFKLLLFAFHRGPLSDASLSLPQFIAIGCLPIKLQEKVPGNNRTRKAHKSLWNYAIKALLIALFLRVYDYGDQIHHKIILVVYCLHIYLMLELMLAVVAALARATLGSELEPQFNEPYLSTSLQDFWGRRWNLMVTRTLRPTVYEPVLGVAARLVGREWAMVPAVLSTFAVSALMHELIFFYLGRTRPTWEITWFFLLHGACLVAENGVKKAARGRWGLPRVVATPLTLGFVVGTGFWLFFPQLLRCKADVRAFEEYAMAWAFLKGTLPLPRFNVSTSSSSAATAA
ncbi:acyl-CoA--sterol O-acyltransferase 1-like [Diospyros lotus]|uniref:acyl-CoA--sterol O-acyltransferase 1-like n=1 Tax=Diospyros lotus TaxID=55363 RepID=UPI00225026B0|nr:acyl-CoA--sterol O-acyltransferase 1-like [Diospyros lotus]